MHKTLAFPAHEAAAHATGAASDPPTEPHGDRLILPHGDPLIEPHGDRLILPHGDSLIEPHGGSLVDLLAAPPGRRSCGPPPATGPRGT